MDTPRVVKLFGGLFLESNLECVGVVARFFFRKGDLWPIAVVFPDELTVMAEHLYGGDFGDACIFTRFCNEHYRLNHQRQ